MLTGFPRVWLLAIVSALAFSITPLMSLLASLMGAELAPRAGWATLPIAAMVVGTACGVWPATRAMAVLNRRRALWIFLALSASTAWVIGQALAWQSFALLCGGGFLLGVGNAAFQQIRFAAMESVPTARIGTAASIILVSGILAAFLGPELAVIGRHFTSTEYQGSFWLAGGVLLIAMLLLLAYSPTQPPPAPAGSQPRPIRKMLQNPRLLLALASATTGYVVMSFVMTGTPISMHLHHGHSLDATKWVIQSHIAAMFAPSLFTPLLLRLLGTRGLIWLGLLCYSATIAMGLLDVSVNGFWVQLVLLGIGWNFLFVAGTTLLPTAHLPGESFRAQALNDGVVFGSQAVASLTAGWAVALLSWQSVLLLCLLPMAAMLVLLIRHRGAL